MSLAFPPSLSPLERSTCKANKPSKREALDINNEVDLIFSPMLRLYAEASVREGRREEEEEMEE